MTTLNKVKEVLAEENKTLAGEYNVARIGVFGSVVRGEDTDDSDIDLLVDFSGPIGLFDLVGLEMYLSDRLGRRVEIATRKGLSRHIRDEIIKQEKTVYEN